MCIYIYIYIYIKQNRNNNIARKSLGSQKFSQFLTIIVTYQSTRVSLVKKKMVNSFVSDD